MKSNVKARLKNLERRKAKPKATSALFLRLGECEPDLLKGERLHAEALAEGRRCLVVTFDEDGPKVL